MRSVATFLFIVLICCCAGQPALADRRVALVIGNSAYESVMPLTNAANDAAAIAKMFKDAGFDIVEFRRDLKNLELRRAVNDFFDAARDADIAVVYYAGHGIEIDGTNYIIPIDAILDRDRDVYDETISLDRLLQSIEPAKQLRLVILDACRDNPFARTMKRTLATRTVSRGLARVEPTVPNTLIAFAAKAGSTAEDGNNEHSPFTASILNHLTSPGLDLRKAFGIVRDEVMNATNNRQEPYVFGSLGGTDVSLVPAPVVDSMIEQRRDYEFAERIATKEAWDYFLEAHGSGFYADLANAQRNKLTAEAARVAATEKARLAAEEQTRLAVEGARASEQARAAAQTKSAEEARLLAETAQKLEEAKVAAAEQAKVIAQAKATENARPASEKMVNLAEAERVRDEARLENLKKPEEIETASSATAAIPENEKAKTQSSGDQTIASLAPSDQAKPTTLGAPAQIDIPRLLQIELKRVGCLSGEVDGNWKASSQRSLGLFNRKAGAKLGVKLASLDALNVVKSQTGRVCPLDCARGYQANGDRCVKIICVEGTVPTSDGTCRKRPERSSNVAMHQEHKPRTPMAPRAGGKCFAFNGKQYCE